MGIMQMTWPAQSWHRGAKPGEASLMAVQRDLRDAGAALFRKRYDENLFAVRRQCT